MEALNRSEQLPDGFRPQAKICGITLPETAAYCGGLGADAIGCVFFPKSPRNVSLDQAQAIVQALPQGVKATGVFVDAGYDQLMKTAEYAGLHAVQLHGQETPELVSRLTDQDLIVIKALFMSREPYLRQADNYPDCVFLVECGKGPLPGGNAETWDWAATKNFGNRYPLILAGGLHQDNIIQAVTAALPDAVDISSGVESAPGKKDREKIKYFLNNLQKSRMEKQPRRIF